jgi:hypothetical protein
MRGLRAALLLSAGRRSGIDLLPADFGGARRSFLAALLCLPLDLGLRWIGWLSTGSPAHPAHAITLSILVFAVGWAGFVALSREMAVPFGREAHWPRFVAAWNWCNVPQYVLLLAGWTPALLGAPPMLAQAAALFTVGWALWIEWYATKVALSLGGLAAASFVAADALIGLVLARLL